MPFDIALQVASQPPQTSAPASPVPGQSGTPRPAPSVSSATQAASVQNDEAQNDDDQVVDEVVVIAERTGVRNQIDRRTYDIGRDPVAQTSSVLEILEKVPSVSVDPSGRLRLLGQSGVTLLIDGQKPVNEQTALRTLTGANIDRIEVMTNPGVQYGPAGTGGIINMITRQRTGPGVTGMVAASLDTYGSVSLNASPNVAWGRWTLNSSLGLSAQDTADRSRVAREVFATPGVPAAISEELRTGNSENQGVTASLKTIYRLSESAGLNGGVELSSSHQDQERRGRIVSADTLAIDHLERTPSTGRYRTLAVSGGYSRTGPREGEELTLAARAEEFVSRSRSLFERDFGVASPSTVRFGTMDRANFDTQSLKLDYKRPLGKAQIATAGLSWVRDGQASDVDVEPFQGAVNATTRRLGSTRAVVAAYGTIQFETARFMILPGLRIEYQDLAVTGISAVGGDSGTDLYPSLHVSLSLTESLKLNLSYSKRINRPDGWLLDPSLTYSRPLEAIRGNPELRPQTIDSFEARLDWARPRWSLSATAYGKEKHDLWSQSRQRFDDGLIILSIINAGNGADRGLELSLRGKLGERFNYVTTTNLFASTKRVLTADGVGRDRTDFAYSGNGQLEYVAPAGEGREADKVQLAINYTGPQQDFQTRSDGSFSASLTWRHPISTRVTAVLLARNVFNNGGYRSRTDTETFSEASRYEGRGVTFRLGLTYSLGGAS